MNEGDFAAGFVAVAVEVARDASNPLLVRGAVRCGPSTLAFGGPDGPAAVCEILEAAREAEGRLLVVWNSGALWVWKRLLREAGIAATEPDCVCLERLVHRALPHLQHPAAVEDVAAALQLPAPDMDRPASVARFTSESFSALLELVPPEHRTNLQALEQWVAAANPPVDFSRFAFGRDWLADLPVTSGVYVMRTSNGDVLYVGKAANVRRRVASYFTSSAQRSAKNRRLHEQLYSVEVVPAESEIEALLTEMRLIRRYRPSINIQSQVHYAAEGFGRQRNLVLLVREPSGPNVTSYFLRRGVFAGRLQARLGRPAPARLRRRVREVFFAPDTKTSKALPWERELVFRWLAHHRRKLNFVDVDDAGSCAETLRQISDYLLDPERLAAKVCYR